MWFFYILIIKKDSTCIQMSVGLFRHDHQSGVLWFWFQKFSTFMFLSANIFIPLLSGHFLPSLLPVHSLVSDKRVSTFLFVNSQIGLYLSTCNCGVRAYVYETSNRHLSEVRDTFRDTSIADIKVSRFILLDKNTVNQYVIARKENNKHVFFVFCTSNVRPEVYCALCSRMNSRPTTSRGKSVVLLTHGRWRDVW